MALSIDSFRNAVGQHSLGYVDLATDSKGQAVGLTKVSNHRVFKFLNKSDAKIDRMLGGNRAMQMRSSFAAAIINEYSGKVAPDRLDAIVNQLMSIGDGKSNKTALSRREIKQTFAVLDAAEVDMRARGSIASLTSYVKQHGTDTEKANLANYHDSILTKENVSKLQNHIQTTHPGRSPQAVQSLMSNLLKLFSELALRQAVTGKEVWSFDRFLNTYAGTSQQLEALDLLLTAEQKQKLQAALKDAVVNGYKAAKQKGTGFHNTTDVYVLAVREYNCGMLKFNGNPCPDKLSENNDLQVQGRLLTKEDLMGAGGTSVSGNDSSETRMAFHENLIRQFPDVEMRKFCSYLLSMADGLKGAYEAALGKDGGTVAKIKDRTELEVLSEYTSGLVDKETLNKKGHPTSLGLVAMPLNNDKGFYDISTDPVSGKVKITLEHAEGWALRGGQMEKLKFKKENANNTDIVLASQTYHTELTIDPFHLDKDGLPSVEIVVR